MIWLPVALPIASLIVHGRPWLRPVWRHFPPTTVYVRRLA